MNLLTKRVIQLTLLKILDKILDGFFFGVGFGSGLILIDYIYEIIDCIGGCG